ncbi:unnamed protein product [Calicophoron daubneyi]|uniref:Uncharacterized protein n=1 Tax=Calicophoron daubneyi TaxID=300641 RepID=A0AAV2T756_CALDB
MFKPNIEQADLASGDPANVMNESPAEGKMTPEYKEVEGTWLALTSVSAPSDRFLQVSTRPVSGAQWTSEMENLKGTWLALTSVSAPSDRFLQVSTRPVSGAQWTSEMENLKNSRLITTSDGDIDDDFDAVLVDNTDMHVQDDIFDSVTKLSENILEDTPERENSTVRQRKSKVTKASPPAVAGELSE